MFHALHPVHRAPSELIFRLRLLKFICLFTSCTAPENGRSLWWSREALARETLLSESSGRARVPKKMTANSEEHENDTDEIPCKPSVDALSSDRPSISLLDTLPSFMALSAAQNAGQESNVTITWMQLAGLYMTQAAIDHGLRYGEIRPGVIDQAFGRWKFNPDIEADDTSDEWQVNAMFWADDELLPGWEDIKQRHQRTLVCFPRD